MQGKGLVAMPGCPRLDLLQGLSMSTGNNDVVEAEIVEWHWPDNTPTPHE